MGQHDDNDDSIAAGFARRDREMKGFPVGPLHPSQVKTPAPSAPQTDEELAREVLLTNYREKFVFHDLLPAVTKAIATARAQGRADALAARGEALTGKVPATPANAAAPATEDLERVAAALWRAWWRAHGESETEIQFPQLYEGARARWIEIAKAGFAAREVNSRARQPAERHDRVSGEPLCPWCGMRPAGACSNCNKDPLTASGVNL